MKKQFTLATLVLAMVVLLYANTAMARVVYSPKFPLNGSYVTTVARLCSPTTDSYVTSLVGTGQGTFTPDGTRGGTSSSLAFTAWVNYLAGLSIPAPAYNTTTDPSVTSSPPLLTETPVEWGTSNSVLFRTEVYLPALVPPVESVRQGSGYFFITSFPFANTLGGNVSTGYAIYRWDENDGGVWNRAIVNFNKTTSQATVSSSKLLFEMQITHPDNSITNYLCNRHIQLNQ